MSEIGGWIAVDLDGTLAKYDGWRGCDHIGEPIPLMLERVKAWRVDGRDVRIFTARVYLPPNDAARQTEVAISIRSIQDWCFKHLGEILPVTCIKDYGMVELWDDRCVQVVPNEGIPVTEAK